jgi:4-hydroxy 2-oxovalerate aldolase
LLQKLIITSNISADQIYLQVKYHDLLNDTDMVKDNAGLMCVKLLMDSDVKEILLAGFDGYSHETEENYAVKDMAYISKNAVLDALNRGISDVLKKFNENVKIKLITSEKYIHIQ